MSQRPGISRSCLPEEELDERLPISAFSYLACFCVVRWSYDFDRCDTQFSDKCDYTAESCRDDGSRAVKQ